MSDERREKLLELATEAGMETVLKAFAACFTCNEGCPRDHYGGEKVGCPFVTGTVENDEAWDKHCGSGDDCGECWARLWLHDTMEEAEDGE